jgi:hypothetical protein
MLDLLAFLSIERVGAEQPRWRPLTRAIVRIMQRSPTNLPGGVSAGWVLGELVIKAASVG